MIMSPETYIESVLVGKTREEALQEVESIREDINRNARIIDEQNPELMMVEPDPYTLLEHGKKCLELAKEYFDKHGWMWDEEQVVSKLELIHGSCADQKVDAVVNAANRDLRKGDGICGVIFSKAGSDELSKACGKYKTPLNDGDAVITPAFNLANAKVIIHAVGPNFWVNKRAFRELQDAYYNSLLVLKDYGYHSISFPMISTGYFSGNIEGMNRESADQCRRAYMRFINDYPDYTITVFLCAYKSREYDEAKSQFDFYNNINPEDMDRWNDGGEAIRPCSKT